MKSSSSPSPYSKKYATARSLCSILVLNAPSSASAPEPMLPIKQTTPIASQPPRSINHEDQRKPRWRPASQPASSPVSAAREEEDLRPFAFSDLSFCGQRGNRVFRQLKVAQREKLQKGPGLGMHAFMNACICIHLFIHTYMCS